MPGDPQLYLCEAVTTIMYPDPSAGPVTGAKIGVKMTIDNINGNAPQSFNMNLINGQVSLFYVFDDTPANLLAAHPPTITYWDSGDVFEKYEAGYCEGVLDDLSLIHI